MKVQSKLFATAMLLVFGMAPAAFAGEGGAAGAASFKLDGFGFVRDASVAGAIGKNTAYAGTTNTPLGTMDAFAVGTGGGINFTGTSVYVNSVTPDFLPFVPQANQLTNSINVDGTNGRVVIDSTP